MGTPLAIGEQATTVYADPRQIAHPRTRRSRSRPRILGLKREAALPAARRPKSHGFVYVERKAPAGQGGRCSRSEASPASASTREERRDLSAGLGRRAGARLRRHRQQRPRRARARAQLRSSPARRARRRSSATRSAARSTSRAAKPARPGQDVFLTHRPHDPGERGAGAAGDRGEVAREGRDRDRARPAHGRRARDGDGAGVRREQLPAASRRRSQTNHAVTDVYEPGSVFKVVTIAGALAGAPRHAEDDVHAAVLDPGRRPRHPRRRDRGRPRRMTVAQILAALVERRHDHDRRDEARRRRGSQEWITGSASASRPASTSRARAPGSAAAVLVGLDDRQRADRAGHRR